MGGARDQVVCGWHAVQAAWQVRPAGLRRLLLAQERSAALGPMLRAMAARRLPYRIAGEDELERASGTRAHQGVVATFEPLRWPQLDDAAVARWAAQPGVWLALDGVGNPHNLGAIARTAAFLGVRGLIVCDGEAGPLASTAALRTAEGALERLAVWRAADLSTTLGAVARLGGATAALCLQDATPLEGWQPPLGRARVLVAGAEEQGVSAAVRQTCSARLAIAGSGAVESLNVGVAVGVALAHCVWQGRR